MHEKRSDPVVGGTALHTSDPRQIPAGHWPPVNLEATMLVWMEGCFNAVCLDGARLRVPKESSAP